MKFIHSIFLLFNAVICQSQLNTCSQYTLHFADISNFILQLPVVNQANDNNKILVIKQDLLLYSFFPFFYFNQLTNALILSVDINHAIKLGQAKTSNSKYSRTELRETNSWSLRDTQLHIMVIKLSVDILKGSNLKGVVIAQVHGKAHRPNLEIVMKKNGNLIVEDHKNKQGTPNSNIGSLITNYKLGTIFTLKILAGNNKIIFFINDIRSNIVMNSSFDDQYFKTGAYCQGNDPDTICQVSLYNIDLS